MQKNSYSTNKKKVTNEDEVPESIKKGISARKKLGSPKVATTRVKQRTGTHAHASMSS